MNVNDQNPRGCDCAYLGWGHAIGVVTDSVFDTMSSNTEVANVEVRKCIVS